MSQGTIQRSIHTDRIDAEEEEIDADQLGIDVGTEILAQITEGLVDEDNVKDWGKNQLIKLPTRPITSRSETLFQDQERTPAPRHNATAETARVESGHERRERQDEPMRKSRVEPVNGIEALHRGAIYPKPRGNQKFLNNVN